MKWVGGKQDLLLNIHKKVPKIINNYHEPFLGGGSVLFYILFLRLQNKILVKNNIYASDANKDLINVYQIIQKNSNLLYDYLNSYSEAYFKNKSLAEKKIYYLKVRDQYNKSKNDNIERAAIFIFLNKTCFRGLYREGPSGFNLPFGNYNNPKIKFDKEKLSFLSFFLQDVIFKHCDFEESIDKCKKGDFIYLDPPYMAENSTSFVSYTKNKFFLDKHLKLFSLVKNLHHKSPSFLMSNSKVNFVLAFFKDFYIEDVLVKRKINAKKPNSRKIEVLIHNNLNKSKNLTKNKFGNGKRYFSTYKESYRFEKTTNYNLTIR